MEKFWGEVWRNYGLVGIKNTCEGIAVKCASQLGVEAAMWMGELLLGTSVHRPGFALA